MDVRWNFITTDVRLCWGSGRGAISFESIIKLPESFYTSLLALATHCK